MQYHFLAVTPVSNFVSHFFIPTNQGTHLHIPTFLPAFLSSYLHTCIPTYLHTYIPYKAILAIASVKLCKFGRMAIIAQKSPK